MSPPQQKESGTISKVKEKRDSQIYSGNSSTVTQNSMQSSKQNKFITDNTTIQIMSVTNKNNKHTSKKKGSKINFIDNNTTKPQMTSTTKSFGMSPTKPVDSQI